MPRLVQEIEFDVVCSECGASLDAYFDQYQKLVVDVCGCQERIKEELWDDNSKLTDEVEKLKDRCLIYDTDDI